MKRFGVTILAAGLLLAAGAPVSGAGRRRAARDDDAHPAGVPARQRQRDRRLPRLLPAAGPVPHRRDQAPEDDAVRRASLHRGRRPGRPANRKSGRGDDRRTSWTSTASARSCPGRITRRRRPMTRASTTICSRTRRTRKPCRPRSSTARRPRDTSWRCPKGASRCPSTCRCSLPDPAKVRFWINPKDGIARKVELEDAQGRVFLRTRYTDVKTDAQVNPEVFELEFPKDVRPRDLTNVVIRGVEATRRPPDRPPSRSRRAVEPAK